MTVVFYIHVYTYALCPMQACNDYAAAYAMGTA